MLRCLTRITLSAALGLTALPAAAQNQMAPGDPGVHAAQPLPGGAVTAWTLAADRLGGGVSNWRTLALMHMAMHDALNAAEPRYARWSAATRTEPRPREAAPLVAMAAAAYQVLLARHPESAAPEADRLFRAAMGAERPGPTVDAAIRLGTAVARAQLAAHAVPPGLPQPFATGTQPGRWRPTPPGEANAVSNRERPFLQGAGLSARPPNPLDSPRYLADLEEIRVLGSAGSTLRTAEQSEAATFWAEQSSQRGYVHMAVALLAANPRPGGVWEEARAMSQLSVALADSAILAWDGKRRFLFWRPVTALAVGSPGAPTEPGWKPFIETPPHPDHPSGHATDCGAGAGVIEGIFDGDIGPVYYSAGGAPGQPGRRFDRVSQAAVECASSRLWAGVHFRTANDEGLRLGAEIARRALASVPPLGQQRARTGALRCSPGESHVGPVTARLCASSEPRT